MENLDPTKDFDQVIANFEQLQNDYQAALAAREAQKRNEELHRQACFAEQQRIYENQQKCDRRVAFCQKLIEQLGLIISEFESQGRTISTLEKIRSTQHLIKHPLETGRIRSGEC